MFRPMYVVTHRAKPHQLAPLIKKILDGVIGSQQSTCETTLQYQYQNMNFCLNYTLFGECSIDIFKEMCIVHDMQIKFAFVCLL